MSSNAGFNGGYGAQQNAGNYGNWNKKHPAKTQKPSTKPAVESTNAPDQEVLTNEEVLEKTLDQNSQQATKSRQNISRERDSKADMFTKSESSEANNQKASTAASSGLAKPDSVKKEELKNTQQNLQNLNNSKLGSKQNTTDAKQIIDNANDNAGQVAANAASLGAIDPDEKQTGTKKKSSKKIGDALKLIQQFGGEKGKAFAQFVKANLMPDGSLMPDIEELVNDYEEIIKSKFGVKTSELVEKHEQPINLLRGMMSNSDISEHQDFANAIATSAVVSATERLALAQVRNLDPSAEKKAPPAPTQIKKTVSAHEKAASYITENFMTGVASTTPWDSAKVA